MLLKYLSHVRIWKSVAFLKMQRVLKYKSNGFISDFGCATFVRFLSRARVKYNATFMGFLSHARVKYKLILIKSPIRDIECIYTEGEKKITFASRICDIIKCVHKVPVSQNTLLLL